VALGASVVEVPEVLVSSSPQVATPAITATTRTTTATPAATTQRRRWPSPSPGDVMWAADVVSVVGVFSQGSRSSPRDALLGLVVLLMGSS
jgi:hypothetical protein